MDSFTLSEDTQAVLLLCSRLGSRDEDPRPLTRSEYNQLAVALHGRGLRPGDLLRGERRASTDSPSEDAPFGTVSPDRVYALLERGAALGFAVEAWTNRGLWVLSRGDERYPPRLKRRLGGAAPPLLYGTGDPRLLDEGGLAVVGSRDADSDGREFTARLSARCAVEGIPVISGGARGVDSIAMGAAGEAGGRVIGVLADSLARAAVVSENRMGIREERLVLISANHPSVGFSVGFAMERNKFLYALADWGLVVSSAKGTGGTWAGAVEDLKKRWVPLFVRTDTDSVDGSAGGEIPEGNRALVAKGGLPFPARVDDVPCSLRDWLDAAAGALDTVGTEVTGRADAASGFGQMMLLPSETPVAVGAGEASALLPSSGGAPSKRAVRPGRVIDEAKVLLAALPETFSRADFALLMTNPSSKRISSLLVALKRAGLVEFQGRGASGRWRRTRRSG